jgi:hypothetical protein
MSMTLSLQIEPVSWLHKFRSVRAWLALAHGMLGQGLSWSSLCVALIDGRNRVMSNALVLTLSYECLYSHFIEIVF